MIPYAEEIEQLMRKYYRTLSEKDRRRYAAIEAKKLGHGGITYIAQVCGCAQSTIAIGSNELDAMPAGSGYDIIPPTINYTEDPNLGVSDTMSSAISHSTKTHYLSATQSSMPSASADRTSWPLLESTTH